MNQSHRTPRRLTLARPIVASEGASFALGAGLLALGMGLLGCSESAAPDKTSTFQGALALDTFPQHPESVQVSNELGSLLQAPVNTAGDFHLDLDRGHRYTLAVNSGSEPVSVVFPRASGRLTSQFDVSSGAASVSLGSVRYFAAAPPAGFFLKSAHVFAGRPAASASAANQADGEVGECVDGKILGTGAICVDDDGDVACEGERSDGDGECEDGVDANTGLRCSDADDAVDPTRPMAVAEHNVPDQVGGCDEGGEEESDD